MSVTVIRKDREWVLDAMRRLTARQLDGYATIAVTIDKAGGIVGLCSDGYPEELSQSFHDDLDEAIARIHAGEGLQS